ncbi:hypothetical protein [Halopseudomonas sp.]|uniref:hypothetical protein n=1 Tax=Halopseudomonas sp. TaxID=2901191 RepID=UPI000C0FCD91|nr:MAG: hypothetical protein COA41_11490 [Sphingopyxis sp.]
MAEGGLPLPAAFGQKRLQIAIKLLAINSRKSIMEATAHAQSHFRLHECLAYLTQAFIHPTYGDLL